MFAKPGSQKISLEAVRVVPPENIGPQVVMVMRRGKELAK